MWCVVCFSLVCSVRCIGVFLGVVHLILWCRGFFFLSLSLSQTIDEESQSFQAIKCQEKSNTNSTKDRGCQFHLIKELRF